MNRSGSYKRGRLEVSSGVSLLEQSRAVFLKCSHRVMTVSFSGLPGVASRGAHAVASGPEGRVACWTCWEAVGWWQTGICKSKGWARCDWRAVISEEGTTLHRRRGHGAHPDCVRSP